MQESAGSGIRTNIKMYPHDVEHHENNACKCERDQEHESKHVMTLKKEYPVYTSTGAAFVTLEGLICNGCHETTWADGQSDGVFVWSLAAGYAHGYLEMIVDSMESTGMTQLAAYSSFVTCMTRAGVHSVPSRNSWMAAVNGYRRMIDDVPCEECPICRDPNNMKYLVVDGTTSGGLQKKLVNWSVKAEATEAPHADLKRTGLLYKEMKTSLGMTLELRILLLRFAGGTVKGSKDSASKSHTVMKQRPELSAEEYDHMRTLMDTCERTDEVIYMSPILNCVRRHYESQGSERSEMFIIPRTRDRKWQTMRDIVVEIASVAKCYSMHNDVEANIKALTVCIDMNGEGVFQNDYVRETCAASMPLLMTLILIDEREHLGSIPKHYLGILRLWKKRAEIYVTAMNECRSNERNENIKWQFEGADARNEFYTALNELKRYEQTEISKEDDAKAGAHCHPALRKQRHAFSYKSMRTKVSKRNKKKRDEDDDDLGAINEIMGEVVHERNAVTEDACTKEQDLSHRFMPGVFTMLCPHGICYGVIFMTEYESPKTLFEAIWNR